MTLWYPLRVQGPDYKAFHILTSFNTPQDSLGRIAPVNWSRPFSATAMKNGRKCKTTGRLLYLALLKHVNAAKKGHWLFIAYKANTWWRSLFIKLLKLKENMYVLIILFKLSQTLINCSPQKLQYCIAGYFQGENFHKSSRIVRSTYILKSKHFEGKIFTNCFQFIKFAKIFPLENNPLYGIQCLILYHTIN